NVVAVSAADGKLLWKTAFPVQPMQYNAATPMVEGQTVIYSGTARGTKAVKFEKKDEVGAKELWSNTDTSVHFNTPVVKNGMIFGLNANDKLFCLDAETGKSLWTADIPAPGGRQRGYGSVVDAGPVLFVLNPGGKLFVCEPSAKEFKQLAKY